MSTDQASQSAETALELQRLEADTPELIQAAARAVAGSFANDEARIRAAHQAAKTFGGAEDETSARIVVRSIFSEGNRDTFGRFIKADPAPIANPYERDWHERNAASGGSLAKHASAPAPPRPPDARLIPAGGERMTGVFPHDPSQGDEWPSRGANHPKGARRL